MFMKIFQIIVVNNRRITIYRIPLFMPNLSFQVMLKDHLNNKRLTNFCQPHGAVNTFCFIDL